MAEGNWETRRELEGNKEAEGSSVPRDRRRNYPPEVEMNTDKERMNLFEQKQSAVFALKTVKGVILFSR